MNESLTQSPAAALLPDLAAITSLSDLDDAGYRRHCDALAAALADVDAPAAVRWELLRELSRVGDRTAIIELGLGLAQAVDPALRRGGLARAAWGSAQLGLHERAEEILAVLAPDIEADPLFALEVEWVRGMMAYMRGDYAVMEARCRNLLSRLPAMPPDAVTRHFSRPLAVVLKQTEVNLIISLFMRADLHRGGERERLLTEAEFMQRQAEAGADRLESIEALLDDTRGELLRRRNPEAALRHFDAALARHAGNPESRYALADLLRHRATVRDELGDRAGAQRDLLEALTLAMASRAAHIERQVAGRLFALIAKHSRAGRREVELLDEFHLHPESTLSRVIELWRTKDRSALSGQPQRVAERSLRLYRLLGGRMPDGGALALDILEACSLLWDIGGLLLPWTVVNRPRPLTALEQQLLSARGSEGARLLEQFGFTHAAQVLRQRDRADDAPLREPHAVVVAHSYDFERLTSASPLNPQQLTPAAALDKLQAAPVGRYHPAVLTALARAAGAG